ncbi:MAG: hypothetical protein U0359_12555 [Byssovorax sp.]
MARTIDSSGDIETICKTSPLRAGDTATLFFQGDEDLEPPFTLKIKSPAGVVIIERVLRELPTGKPQSAPPVTLTLSAAGEYKIEIKRLNGKQKGEAILRVID